MVIAKLLPLGSIYQWHIETDGFLNYMMTIGGQSKLFTDERSYQQGISVTSHSEVKPDTKCIIVPDKPRSENGTAPTAWIDLMITPDKLSACCHRCLQWSPTNVVSPSGIYLSFQLPYLLTVRDCYPHLLRSVLISKYFYSITSQLPNTIKWFKLTLSMYY